MVAVETVRQLKTKSTVLLACLAATDFIVGLTVQPLLITIEIYVLKEVSANDFCTLENASGILLHMFCGVSLRYLALISLERYLAIKHPFFYDNHISNTRLLVIASAAWVMALIATMIEFMVINVEFAANRVGPAFIILSIPVIFCCHVVLYIEVRRHEKQIISQKIFLEAKQEHPLLF